MMNKRYSINIVDHNIYKDYAKIIALVSILQVLFLVYYMLLVYFYRYFTKTIVFYRYRNKNI